MGFYPGSWPRAPKTIVSPCDGSNKGIICEAEEVTFWKRIELEAGCPWSQPHD